MEAVKYINKTYRDI